MSQAGPPAGSQDATDMPDTSSEPALPDHSEPSQLSEPVMAKPQSPGRGKGSRPSSPNVAGSESTTLDPEASLLDAERTSVSGQSVFSAGLSIDSDNDSAMGDLSGPMSTMSLRSSIYDYVEENGRTFHRYKQGKYWMPNDQIEQERLDLQHAVFLQLLGGKLGIAPVGEPQSVLDIGTGTGIWAIEYACQHPAADVVGTDLSPIQPAFVPPNCRFEVDDAEDEWVFTQSFDYVHLRLVFHGFKSHPTVMASAFENLKPGGWMEWQDYYCDLQAVDDSLKGTALKRWCQLWIEGGGRLGRDMLAPRKYKQWMQEAGFINVTEQKLAIPGNPWPKGREMKTMGMWQMTNFLDGINAVCMTIFTKGLGMSPEEVELFLVDVRKDIQNLNIHFYFLTFVVYGQKPYDRPSAVVNNEPTVPGRS